MDFVIHKLLKNVKGPVTEKYRRALIKPTSDEVSFVKEVTRLFQRHHSGRIYGNFESDLTKFPFSGLLTKHQADGNFLAFSTKAAKLLAKRMRTVPTSTGGFFFAANFEEAGEKLLLIFMLNQQVGRAVDEATLSLRKTVNLQMEHLDLATRINITQWEAKRPEPVSLIRGRKEVSDYFKSFIGLHEPRTNTEATQNLKRFTEDWMDKYKYPGEQREGVRERIVGYATKRGPNPVELEVVAAIVDEDRHKQFFEVANDALLGAEFHVDRNSLKAWERVVYSEPGGDIKLNFAKRLLLTGRVQYSRENRTLLINDVELPESNM